MSCHVNSTNTPQALLMETGIQLLSAMTKESHANMIIDCMGKSSGKKEMTPIGITRGGRLDGVLRVG